MKSTLHRDAIVIDGLNISRWGPETFQAMHQGGLTAVNCTCCVWEGFLETTEALARWKQWFREHSDISRRYSRRRTSGAPKKRAG